MSDDELGFFKAARENPDDDTIRLVYADWLEDHGTEAFVEQARFVRLQVERSRLPLDSPQRTQALEQEATLLRRYRRKWNGRIHRWLHAQGIRHALDARHGVVRALRFHRGMISHVTIRSYVLDEAIALAAKLGPIQGLRLVGWPSQGWPKAMLSLQQLGPLKLLQLSGQFPWQSLQVRPTDRARFEAGVMAMYRELPAVPILDLRALDACDPVRIQRMLSDLSRQQIVLCDRNPGGVVSHHFVCRGVPWVKYSAWFADFLGDTTTFTQL